MCRCVSSYFFLPCVRFFHHQTLQQKSSPPGVRLSPLFSSQSWRAEHGPITSLGALDPFPTLPLATQDLIPPPHWPNLSRDLHFNGSFLKRGGGGWQGVFIHRTECTASTITSFRSATEIRSRCRKHTHRARSSARVFLILSSHSASPPEAM